MFLPECTTDHQAPVETLTSPHKPTLQSLHSGNPCSRRLTATSQNRTSPTSALRPHTYPYARRQHMFSLLFYTRQVLQLRSRNSKTEFERLHVRRTLGHHLSPMNVFTTPQHPDAFLFKLPLGFEQLYTSASFVNIHVWTGSLPTRATTGSPQVASRSLTTAPAVSSDRHRQLGVRRSILETFIRNDSPRPDS